MKRTSYISDVLSHALVEVGGGARAEYLVGSVPRTFHKTHAHNNTQKTRRHTHTNTQKTVRHIHADTHTHKRHADTHTHKRHADTHTHKRHADTYTQTHLSKHH